MSIAPSRSSDGYIDTLHRVHLVGKRAEIRTFHATVEVATVGIEARQLWEDVKENRFPEPLNDSLSKLIERISSLVPQTLAQNSAEYRTMLEKLRHCDRPKLTLTEFQTLRKIGYDTNAIGQYETTLQQLIAYCKSNLLRLESRDQSLRKTFQETRSYLVKAAKLQKAFNFDQHSPPLPKGRIGERGSGQSDLPPSPPPAADLVEQPYLQLLLGIQNPISYPMPIRATSHALNFDMSRHLISLRKICYEKQNRGEGERNTETELQLSEYVTGILEAIQTYSLTPLMNVTSQLTSIIEEIKTYESCLLKSFKPTAAPTGPRPVSEQTELISQTANRTKAVNGDEPFKYYEETFTRLCHTFLSLQATRNELISSYKIGGQFSPQQIERDTLITLQGLQVPIRPICEFNKLAEAYWELFDQIAEQLKQIPALEKNVIRLLDTAFYTLCKLHKRASFSDKVLHHSGKNPYFERIQARWASDPKNREPQFPVSIGTSTTSAQ